MQDPVPGPGHPAHLVKLAERRGINAPDLERALRRVGYGHEVSGLRDVLDCLAQLEHDFDRVGADLPFLGETLADFALVRSLGAILSAAEVQQLSSPNELAFGMRPWLFPACRHGLRAAQHVPEKWHQAAWGWCAIGWAVGSWAAGENRLDLLSPKFEFPDPVVWLPHSLEGSELGNDPDLFARVADVGVRRAAAAARRALAGGRYAKDTQVHVEILDRLQRLVDESANATEFARTSYRQSGLGSSEQHRDDEEEEEQAREYGRRPASRLTERELLKEHHRAINPAQRDRLSKAIVDALTRRRPAPFHYEAVLAALAFVTGHSISQVLNLSIARKRPEAATRSEWLVVGFSRDDMRAWVRPLQDSGRAVYLPLPGQLADAIGRHLKGVYGTSAKVSDLLPYSAVDWTSRTERWLAELLEVRESAVRLMVRHSMAREIYALSSTHALIYFLFADLTDTGSKSVESRTDRFYLDFTKGRVEEVYVAACERLLFDRFGANFETYRSDRPPILLSEASSQFRAALKESRQALVANISDGRVPDVLIAFHNDFAAYVLLMLVVSTGHRQSKTPFSFRWDLLSDGSFVFICDKITVGSEARFVPLAPSVREQIDRYFEHLAGMIKRAKALDPDLAAAIIRAASGASMDFAPNEPGAGTSPFFRIEGNESGRRLRTIRTAHLDLVFRKLPRPSPWLEPITVRRLRRHLATYLWNQGHSGQQVDALLGHASQGHPFGAGSTWSPCGLAEILTPTIERYVSLAGLKVEISPLAAGQQAVPAAIPSRRPGRHGYEGRNRDLQLAAARARKAIERVIPAEWVDNDGQIEISSVDAQSIRAEASELLSDDGNAQAKLQAELNDFLAHLRGPGRRVLDPSVNLQRREPSPVGVTFSRDLARAQHLIARLPGAFARAQAGPPDIERRLSLLAISLIVFDAVLEPRQLAPLLLAAGDDQTMRVGEAFLLRAQIRMSNRIFERAVLTSPESTAVIIGLRRLGTHSLDAATVEKCLSAGMTQTLVRSGIGNANSDWSARAICTLMRPFWFLRLPGWLYAAAIGLRESVAPDSAACSALLGMPLPKGEAGVAPVEGAKKRPRPIDDPEQAAQAVLGLLRDDDNTFEQRRGASSLQRAALRERLAAPLQSTLETLARAQPVVDYLIGFIEYLLVVGGERREVLAYSSIRGYVSRVAAPLIRRWWSADILEFDSDKFDATYREIVAERTDQTSDAATVLRQFHAFMMTEYDVPRCALVRSGQRAPINMRGSLVGLAAVDQAMSEAVRPRQEIGSEVRRAAADLIAINSSYGCRRMEGLGIRAGSFEHIESKTAQGRIVISRNSARGIKSRAPRRVPFAVGSLQARQRVQKALARSAVGNVDRWVFEDIEQEGRQLDSNAVASLAIASLRTAAKYRSVNLHTLRHTFATRVLLAMSPPAALITSVERFRQSLLGVELDWTESVAALQPSASDWPFGVDRVAAWLGHGDVETIATYWHGDFACIAECARKLRPAIEWRDAHLAYMLGRDRTAIVHRRTRLRNQTGKQEIPVENIVEAFLGLGDRHSPDPPEPAGAAEDSKPSRIASSTARDIADLDRVLTERRALGLSLDSAKVRLAEVSSLSLEAAGACIDGYVDVVRASGIDHFEPPNSELLHVAKQRAGVQRFADERQRRLIRAQHWLKESARSIPLLRDALREWAASQHRSEFPWVVSSIENARIATDVLSFWGVARAAICVTCIGFEPSRVAAELGLPPEKVQSSSRRASPGPTRVRVHEIAIGAPNGSTESFPAQLTQWLVVLASHLAGVSN